MKPKIYKPGAYNTPGIYKGAGGIYKGAGIYNSDITSVNIGGREYKVIKIRGKYWISENLDYKFQYNGAELPIGVTGGPTTPAAWYYNNNEAQYGIDAPYKFGLMYNWYAAKYLNDNRDTLIPGWHVPTLSEFSDLIAYVGGDSIAGKKLKAQDNFCFSGFPNGWGGDNEFNFNALPSGYRLSNGNFLSIGSAGWLWACDEYNGTDGNTLDFSTLDNSIPYHYPKKYAFSLRLVKD